MQIIQLTVKHRAVLLEVSSCQKSDSKDYSGSNYQPADDIFEARNITLSAKVMISQVLLAGPISHLQNFSNLLVLQINRQCLRIINNFKSYYIKITGPLAAEESRRAEINSIKTTHSEQFVDKTKLFSQNIEVLKTFKLQGLPPVLNGLS